MAMASWSWGLSFFRKPISSKAVELHLDILLLSRLYLCFVSHGLRRRRRGGGREEMRIHGCSLPSKFLKLDTLENGVHTGGLTEFHGLKQVNPSNCHIPSLFVSLGGKWSVGLDILPERQVKTLRNWRHFYNYFLRKHSEFLTSCVMTISNPHTGHLQKKINVNLPVSSAVSSLRNDIFSSSSEYFLQLDEGVNWCQLWNMLR